MPKNSAGLLMYRWREWELQVLLVHPGGPLWAKKDLGAWSIPKGEVVVGEEPLATARREFEEELGVAAEGDFLPLGSVTQKSRKAVHAWAFEGNCDPSSLLSNSFTMEWPLHSGRQQQFPEVDRSAFFALNEAKEKLNPAQTEFIDRLEHMILPKDQ